MKKNILNRCIKQRYHKLYILTAIFLLPRQVQHTVTDFLDGRTLNVLQVSPVKDLLTYTSKH